MSDAAAPRRMADLIAAGTLDAELAATLWLLVEGRVPMIAASAERGLGTMTLVRALLDFLPSDTTTIELAGAAETFEWLPQASELGWDTAARPAPLGGGPIVRPGTTLLLAQDMAGGSATSAAHGAVARLAIRAATIGYGLAATVCAASLEEVFQVLGRPPVGADQDELSRLGVVLVLGGARTPEGAHRVTAAHYVRPTARDEHGHVQRPGPAVLATWDADRGTFEHFGWGVTPELAVRVGRRAGDFELEVDRRRRLLAGLAEAPGAS